MLYFKNIIFMTFYFYIILCSRSQSDSGVCFSLLAVQLKTYSLLTPDALVCSDTCSTN